MLFISVSISLAATCAEGYIFISASSLHAVTLQHRHAFTLPFTCGFTLYKRVVYSRIPQSVLYLGSLNNYLVSI